MAPEPDTRSDLVVVSSEVSEENALTVEFKLRREGGEPGKVKYSERKGADDSIEYVGLEIELGERLMGNIFKSGDSDPVAALFSRRKGISVPFRKGLGDEIREHYDTGVILAFIGFLKWYPSAGALWEKALAVTSDRE